ncbi:DUF4157 domain-containing protein [Streptomyces sp. G5(2025)]|uniref:eCIS core domain-containing protein n=1 Tax=Streptomyces sp. G5(2025) TaxID=3406628 RepID=UPI003C237B24
MVQMLRHAGHRWAQPAPHQHGPSCGHQAAAVSPAPGTPAVQRSAVHDVLHAPGRPLDENTRTDMEERLGADFSDVRIHDDTSAKASAARLGARAYTSGSHVVIGEGGGDRHTLAHELTHVIQQRQGPVSGTDHGDGLKVSNPSDRYEREAEANATRVLSGPPRRAEAGPEETPARTTGGTEIQRQIVHQTESNPQDPDSAHFWIFAKAVDDAVLEAYNYVLGAPMLGNYATSPNGHIQNWLKVWPQFLAGGIPGGISKEFGYVVETLADHFLKQKSNSGAPAGYSPQTQVPVGGTRPDYLLIRASDMGYAGAVDITASSSAGHILAKDGWGNKFARFCESVYPSLDAQAVQTMRVNNGNIGAISQQQMIAAQAQAAANQQLANHILANMKNHFERSMDQVNVMTGGKLTRGKDPLLVGPYRQEAVMLWMRDQFSVADPRIAASLVQKLGYSPATFGLEAYSASDSVADAFLNLKGVPWQASQDAAMAQAATGGG